MASPPETLCHGQISLRRWRPDDAAALLAAVIASQEHLRPWMPWADQYDEDKAAEFLRECDAQWAAGDAFAYAIIADGPIVGSAGLLPHRRRRSGVGYWVHATGPAAASDRRSRCADGCRARAARHRPGGDSPRCREHGSGRVPAAGLRQDRRTPGPGTCGLPRLAIPAPTWSGSSPGRYPASDADGQ